MRELWEQNRNSKEMLQILTEKDGFSLDMRDLTRLRQRFGLKMRESVGGFGNLGPQKPASAGARNEQSDSSASSGSGSEDESESESDEEGGQGVTSAVQYHHHHHQYQNQHDQHQQSHHYQQNQHQNYHGSVPSDHYGHQNNLPEMSVSPGWDMPGLELTPEEQARRDERIRQLAAESMEKWATKKRRRRTKAYAGLPADPPGPPRFPSETTLAEAKVILQLDNDAYQSLRTKFQHLCEKAGVIKKTIAGPEIWEALKEQLIRESMHLRAVMWDQENIEQKKLAIDVIACDVTKRMRTMNANSVITISEAKRILGLNPEQGRQLRAALFQILMEHKFTALTVEGEEKWNEMKQKWFMGDAFLHQFLNPPDAAYMDPEFPRKKKAIDTLARDVVRRYREDIGRKGRKPGEVPKPRAKRARKTTDDGPNKRQATAPTFKTPHRGPKKYVRKADRNAAATHTEARFLPPPLGDDEAGSAASSPAEALSPMADTPHMDNTDTALLLDADTPEPASHNQFADAQYVQGYVAATQSNNTPVFNQQHQQQSQQQHVSTHQHQAQQLPPPPPPPAPPAPSTTIGVYFRLHPSSPYFGGTTPSMWISMIHSRSINELRSVAVEKVSPGGMGVVCLAIEGIIKDTKTGTELPLPVNDDVELDAYLDHVVGQVGVGAPTFSVTIVPAVGGY